MLLPAATVLAELDAAASALGDRARTATVAVRAAGGAGSGIRWSADRVLTCAHCVSGPRVSVDVDGRTYDARVERIDVAADVAVLELSRTAAPNGAAYGLELRDAATLRPGELVFAFGHPLGARDVLARGVVRRATDRLVVSDVPLAPGNSGGPLFDAAGRLVGMNSAIARGRAFSVATETIERVRRGGAEARLGVAVVAARVRAPGGPATVLVVTAVEPDSDAERARVALGDAIVAIDGRPVDGARALERLGSAERLRVLRAGRLVELTRSRRSAASAAA